MCGPLNHALGADLLIDLLGVAANREQQASDEGRADGITEGREDEVLLEVVHLEGAAREDGRREEEVVGEAVLEVDDDVPD